MHIVWLGYYPLNEQLLQRKLQIADRIPERDKVIGLAYHHFYSREKLLSILEDKTNNRGVSLQTMSMSLYNILSKITGRN